MDVWQERKSKQRSQPRQAWVEQARRAMAGTHPQGWRCQLAAKHAAHPAHPHLMDQVPKSSRVMACPCQPLKSPMSSASTAPGAHSRYTIWPPSRTMPYFLCLRAAVSSGWARDEGGCVMRRAAERGGASEWLTPRCWSHPWRRSVATGRAAARVHARPRAASPLPTPRPPAACCSVLCLPLPHSFPASTGPGKAGGTQPIKCRAFSQCTHPRAKLPRLPSCCTMLSLVRLYWFHLRGSAVRRYGRAGTTQESVPGQGQGPDWVWKAGGPRRQAAAHAHAGRGTCSAGAPHGRPGLGPLPGCPAAPTSRRKLLPFIEAA